MNYFGYLVLSVSGGEAEAKPRCSGGDSRGANGGHIQPNLLQVLGGGGGGGVGTAMDGVNRAQLGGGVGGDKVTNILF